MRPCHSLDHRPAGGLYIHVPFCARACPYCDFDFEVGALHKVPQYLNAIAAQVSAALQDGWTGFDTIYLGGGTPSALNLDQLRALFAAVSPLVDQGELGEVTVELNPEHWSTTLGQGLLQLGVHRLSLGVQSFGARALSVLGRAHKGDQAKAVIKSAKVQGFLLSCDLMVGWPGQREGELMQDLETVTQLGVDHVSVYALTVHEASSWPKLVKRGLRQDPDPDHQAGCLAQVKAHLEAQGYLHYEIASYAKHGAIARHNSKYWSGASYLGLGPSAHSARATPTGDLHRWSNRSGLDRWLADPLAKDEDEWLRGQACAAEALWLSLRRLDGMSCAQFLARFPQLDPAWLADQIESLVGKGLVQRQGDALRVAPGAWLLHDEIALTLL